MRADRLVALLLLLQQRQQVTAAMVASELEISERTARRDLEALCMAGLPVYSERGRGGGWRLLGGGRTDLSGLTAQEARALFLVAGPASAATPELKAALRKLVRALPESFRSSAEAAASSVVLDPHGWGRNRPAYRPRYLDVLQEATTEGQQVRLGYSDRTGNITVRTVHPLGLAQKGTTWYLVAGTEEGLRTFRVGRVRSVEETGQPVVRPEGFELSRSWAEVVQRVEGLRSLAEVSALADPDVVDALQWLFEGQVIVGKNEAGGRVPVTVRGQRVEMIARQLSAFGHALEVVAPPEARQILARLGHELVSTYGEERVGDAPGRSTEPAEVAAQPGAPVGPQLGAPVGA
jgi:predicted DNA-binding transcriptional regulator YafY